MADLARPIPQSQMPYLRALYYSGKSYSIGNSSLQALERRGLVTRTGFGETRIPWAITDAGRAALREAARTEREKQG